MIHVNIGYTTTVHSVDKRMWHTNETQPRKQTKTLLFPHGKGKGCKGYGTTPRPLNHNKRTMTAPHLRSGSPAWDNNSPGALAEHQALDRTSSSQATDETQTASHRHPHESRFCSLVARITLRGIQLQSCIWYQMNTAGYWRFAGQKAQCWESQCKSTNIKLDMSQSVFACVFLARLAFWRHALSMDTIIISDIFRRSQGYWQSHDQKNTWQIWSLCHENGDSHAQNLSPSAHPSSPRWDKSFWQRPYTSAMAILSLQRNDIIEFQKWLHRSVWWYVVNMIWSGKDTKQQNSNIYLHGFEVPDSKFLLISSSLATSSQGVKQTILREQSICLCCALPSYITGAPTTLANQYNPLTREAYGKAGTCRGKIAFSEGGIMNDIEDWAARVMSPWSLELKTGDGF